MHLIARFLKRSIYYFRQVQSYFVFGKRVYVHGSYFVGNAANVSIGTACTINDGVRILGQDSIIIGDNVTLSAGCMLLDSGLVIGGARREHMSSKISIGNGVWIGAGAIVLAGVTIGENTVIGAGSVVTRDVPPGVVALGSPARVVRVI